MESSLITGGDVAAIAPAPADQDVRKRWLLLAVALVVGLVAAFAIGSAVKKTSAPPAPTGSLAQSSSASAQTAAITPLTNAGAVPALHAPPPKPKVKKATPTNSSPASTSSSAVSSSSSSPVTQSSSPVQSASTPATSAGSTSSGSTSAGSTSSGTSSGVTHTGGGGGGGNSAG